MIDPYYITVIFISMGAAFFSGLLGIGGGIIIFPSFLYLMPILGFKIFTVGEITGIAAIQSFSGVFFSYINHRKLGNVNIKLVKKIFPIGLIGGLLGSVSAKFISEKILLIIYFLLLIIAVITMLIPETEEGNKNGDCIFEIPNIAKLLIFFGTTISGSLGFAGAVIFIPIINYFCKASIKVAISTTIFTVLITTGGVLAGKFFVGLIPFDLIIPIIIGAVFGANLGARLNKALSSFALKTILIFIIVILDIRIFLTILQY